MRVWKVLGVASLAGVAATGVVIARNERARRAYTPEQVHARLHARLSESTVQSELHSPAEVATKSPWTARVRGWLMKKR